MYSWYRRWRHGVLGFHWDPCMPITTIPNWTHFIIGSTPKRYQCTIEMTKWKITVQLHSVCMGKGISFDYILVYWIDSMQSKCWKTERNPFIGSIWMNSRAERKPMNRSSPMRMREAWTVKELHTYTKVVSNILSLYYLFSVLMTKFSNEIDVCLNLIVTMMYPRE